MDNIKNVIIPAAGLGTRFLPLTKSIPKEMLPLGNKPAIQYIIQEAMSSNLNDFIVITNESKQAISNYFKTNAEFNNFIKSTKKEEHIQELQHIINSCNIDFVIQKQQLGLGHAVLMAKNLIKENYFAVMLPDDIIISCDPAINQLINISKTYNASVIAVQEVAIQNISSYGVIKIKNQLSSNLFEVTGLIEKPNTFEAPSNYGIIGRYILSNNIFDSIIEISKNCVGEIQLTNAISNLIKNGHKVIAYKIDGVRHDIGTPVGWAKAINEMTFSK